MTAGKGIALGSNVIDVRLLIHGAKALDLWVVKIGASSHEDIFDQGVNNNSQHDAASHIGAHLLINSPV